MSVRPPRRILITRPREDAEPLAAILAGHGIDSLIEPLMRAEFVPGERLVLDDVQALIATSANGVRAFAARDPRRSLPVCAVGDATARAARAEGFAEVASASGDVEALAEMIIAGHDPAAGAFLHIAGAVSAGDLGGRLAAAGFAYRRTVLYAMRPARALSPPARDAVAAGRLSGVALYSPRTATLFAELIAADDLAAACRDLRAYCLSQAVAQRVAALPFSALIVAPDQPAMVAAILEDAAAQS
ncbi:MAG: uroporphyrinogen-III synthase [Rhodospirillales bacterium]